MVQGIKHILKRDGLTSFHVVFGNIVVFRAAHTVSVNKGVLIVNLFAVGFAHKGSHFMGSNIETVLLGLHHSMS